MKKIRARYFSEEEIIASPERKEAWLSKDTASIDRLIMRDFPHLEHWVRVYAPDELQIERENMITGNMLHEDILSSTDQFDRMHAGTFGRFVVVANRSLAIRLFYPVDFPRTGRYCNFSVDDQFHSHMKTMKEKLGLIPASAKTDEPNAFWMRPPI